METYLLEEMTWPEIKEAMEKGMTTVIIYAASVEQHGPHLAEITDTVLGQNGAVDLAKRLKNALVAPVIRPGLSAHHLCFPGSITLRPEIFKGLVEDYITSYVHHGFETIILSSSHGGNFKMMEEIAIEQAEKYPQTRIVSGLTLEELDASLAELEELEGLPRGTCGGHACDYETSVMRMVSENHVRMDQARPGFVGEVSAEVLKKFFEKGVSEVSEIGVMGDPSRAEAERGARYFKYTQDLQEKAVREHLAQWDETHGRN